MKKPQSPYVTFISYFCSDCRMHLKSFSLWLSVDEIDGRGVAYKYGEKPPFGIPVPNKVLRLFGKIETTSSKAASARTKALGSEPSPTTGAWSRTIKTKSLTRSSKSVRRSARLKS